jgi:hypothetical protein
MFTSSALFRGATFINRALFNWATFTSSALLGETTFTGGAYFHETTFTGPARFDGATFTGAVQFKNAKVLHLDNPLVEEQRSWPPGWTVRPDPVDPTRGTLDLNVTDPPTPRYRD